MRSSRVTRAGLFPLVATLLALYSRVAHGYEAEPTPAYPTSLAVYPAPRAVGADRPAAPKEWEDQDHVRVGALLGLGFPRPLAIQGLVKIERIVALGVEYGMMPPMKIGPIEGSFWGVSGDARVFPFRGAFFLGLRGGYQRMSATATAELGALGTLVESATAETWFLNPRVGFLWTFRSSLTIGIDVGVQLPVKTTLASSLPAQLGGLPGDVSSSIKGVADTFGHDVVPTVDLLRIGFLL